MKTLKRLLSVVAIYAQILFAIGPALPAQAAEAIATDAATPILSTDKSDYLPGSTVHVTGTNFEVNSSFVITVTAGQPAEEDYYNLQSDVFSDSVGGFLYTFQLDNVFRPLYHVTASDLDGNIVAQTSFTDASIGTYDQCSNDLGAGYTTGDTGCRWINGNINGNNSTYFEGDATVQRLAIDGFVPGSTHTVTFQYGTTKAGKHAYDFLTNWNWSENWITLADRCQGITGCETVPETTIPMGMDSNVPDIGGVPNGIEPVEPSGAPGPRVFTMRGGTLNSATNPVLASGTYTGDSETNVTVSFTVANSGNMCTTKQGTTTCGIAIWFGAHIAETSSWTAFNGTTGATTISGSPYHVALLALDGGSVGQRDNQMQASAIVVVDNPVISTAIHLGSNHTTDVQNTTIALGSTIHDRAVVDNTGGANGTPTGTVTFSFFTNGTCTLPAASTSSALALSSGVVDATGFAQGPLQAGSYSFKASYTSSDLTKWNNAVGACEPVTVGQGTSTVTTTLHNAAHSIVTIGGSVPLGTIMHDLATVTPSSSFAPTGNVNFTFWNNGSCDGTGTAMGSVALNGANPGVAHPSDATSALAAGQYSFQATWAGDTNYTGNTSECENFSVNQGTTEITTDLHNHADHSSVAVGGHVPLGTTMHDSATVTVSGSFAPTGSVMFRFFDNGACEGNGVDAGTVALDGSNPGIAHPSNEFGPLGAGSYSFMASWAGDSNYPQGVSICENFIVDKAQLEVTTEVHNDAHVDITNGNVPLGSIVHDTANVSGEVSGFSIPTPTFTLTSGYVDSCAAGVAVGNDGMEGDAYKSLDSAALGAGNYAYRGAVAGNENYLGDVSDCEPFTVDKASLTVTTEVHNSNHTDITNSSVALGSIVHDTATVTGGVQGFPLPAVSFTMTTDYINDCSEGSAVALDGTDSGNGGVKTVDTGALAAGSYAYRGEVDGNDNYIGDVSECEPFTVDKADLDITTELHQDNESIVAVGGHVDLGTIMHDQATVTGRVPGFPTNDAEFYFYANDTCTEGEAAGVVALDGSGVAHPSESRGPLAAGTYSFNAEIDSNSNYNGDVSACETFIVDKDTPAVSTMIHLGTNHNVDVQGTHIDLGSTIHDSATVDGIGIVGLEPSGNVQFTFFNNLTCSPEGTDSGTIALDGSDPGLAHPSDPQGPLGAGDYSFLAHYVGDSNYESADATCESVIVDKAQLRVSTAVHDFEHADQTGQSVPLGSVMHDTADVTGDVAGFAFPDPVFTLTSNFVETCDQGAAVNNDGNEGDLFKSADSGPLTPGDYAYRATVAGNDNYLGDTGICEPFSVTQSDSRVSTELHLANEDVLDVGGSVEAGASLHDSATVSANGVFDPTGDVNFTFYENYACEGAGTGAGILALDGVSNPSAVHPSNSAGALVAGQYSFNASWGGDANYTGNTSSCEYFNVVDASIALSPQTGFNQVGDPHVITAHVTKNDGTGDMDAPGETVTFVVSSGSATFVGGINTCVTDGTGQCSVSIESNTTGDNTIDASVSLDVNGVMLDRATDVYAGPGGSDGAEKRYVNARISITPANDTNPIDEEHVMTVTVAYDNGSGWTPYEGAIVNSIVSPTTTLDKTDCLAGTDTFGQCELKINSATPGVFTTYARSTITVDSVEFKLATNGSGDNSGPAVKTYVDVTIDTVIHRDGDESTNYDLNNGGSNLPLGSSVHDQATVTPSSGTIPAEATVTYSWFTNSDCSGTPVSTEQLALGTESSSSGALTPGDYSYSAHFDGSYPYPAKTAACERLHVNQGSTRTSTELHEDADHAIIALDGESVTGNAHDLATVVGDTDGFDPTGDVTFRFYGTQQACALADGFVGGVLKGTVALDASGIAHPSDATGALAAGNYAFKARYNGDSNYTASVSDCENFTVSTLTIHKLANGGNDTFGYTVTGPTNATPNITTTGTPGTGTTTIVVLAGQYTVGETTIPAGWQLVGLTCNGQQTQLGPTSEPFNIPAGQDKICNFENTKAGATRTQGFWQTHTVFANDVWTNDVPASEKNVNLWAVAGCTTDKFIDADPADNELMGGFWSNIAKKSNGLGHRSNLDKARMVLVQQLLAAELNRYGLGTNDGGAIAAGKAAYCGTNLNAIRQSTGALDAFNQSGDDVPLGFSTPAATPKLSKQQADIPFWDNPTN